MIKKIFITMLALGLSSLHAMDQQQSRSAEYACIPKHIFDAQTLLIKNHYECFTREPVIPPQIQPVFYIGEEQSSYNASQPCISQAIELDQPVLQQRSLSTPQVTKKPDSFIPPSGYFTSPFNTLTHSVPSRNDSAAPLTPIAVTSKANVSAPTKTSAPATPRATAVKSKAPAPVSTTRFVSYSWQKKLSIIKPHLSKEEVHEKLLDQMAKLEAAKQAKIEAEKMAQKVRDEMAITKIIN